LVATWDLINEIIRMKMADSGELIGQWQALREQVIDVAIAVKAGLGDGRVP
jgi:hypothetical protein